MCEFINREFPSVGIMPSHAQLTGGDRHHLALMVCSLLVPKEGAGTRAKDGNRLTRAGRLLQEGCLLWFLGGSWRRSGW